jgi:hypothetical protein
MTGEKRTFSIEITRVRTEGAEFTIQAETEDEAIELAMLEAEKTHSLVGGVWEVCDDQFHVSHVGEVTTR